MLHAWHFFSGGNTKEVENEQERAAGEQALRLVCEVYDDQKRSKINFDRSET